MGYLAAVGWCELGPGVRVGLGCERLMLGSSE